jgi:uncharacterized membrane protein YqaE (UPF0057 family)
MKKFLFVFSAILFAAIFFSSCSENLRIEKRKYNKGFYVHYTGKNSGAEIISPNAEEKIIPGDAVSTKTAGISNQEVAKERSFAPVKEEKHSSPGKSQKNPAGKIPGASEKTNKLFPAPKTNVLHSHARAKAPAADDQVTLILMVILAIILSPIAVYLKEGATKRFWIDLICWLLGGGLFLTPFFYGGLLLLFAIIFALLIVLDSI